jgi:hypothetical protein
MSDRERWIVYPLLLLAIGLAMGNRIVLQDEEHGGEADVIRCKGLEVIGPEGKPTISLSTSEKGNGMVEVGDAQGQLQSRLSANASGATLQLLDHDAKLYEFIGHYANRFGLFAGDAEGAKVLSLLSFATHVAPREPKAKPDNGTKSPDTTNAPDTDEKSPAAEKPANAPVNPEDSTDGSSSPAQK